MLEISSVAMRAILAHAAADPAHEACGLLFGSPDRIEAAEPAANVAPDPARRFEIDPAALFRAIRAERAGGPKLLGYYHSHPNGSAEPSATDRAMASGDDRIWLIVGGGSVTAWRASPDGLMQIRFDQN